MNNVHGIIFAYQQYPGLGELGSRRTAAALPFCGRYRLIDFALSAMMNAGVFNVDVLMQYGYQSLIDHMGGGRPWNMVRHSGGLHLMPIRVGQGIFNGTMDALEAIQLHLRDEIKEDFILMTRGALCANLDLNALIEAHLSSDADITAICTRLPQSAEHNRFLPEEANPNIAADLLCRQTDAARGMASLETYIIRRDKLLEMLRWCNEANRAHFHRNALIHFMRHGMRVGLYMHEGYARFITTIQDYYDANMAMLTPSTLAQLFPEDRHVATRSRSNASSYYGDAAKVVDSLVADGCIIEGKLERCIVFSGARIEAGSSLRDCILMNDAVIGKNTDLQHVVTDKNVTISSDQELVGSLSLPLVIPKGSVL